MSYFLAFLGLLSASVCFLGRPILTSLIMSSVSEEYMACLEMGFIPALCILASTVLKGSFNAAHISSIVRPSIAIISTEYQEKLKNARIFLHLLYKYVVELQKIYQKSEDFFLYLLTICRKFPILYYIS